MQQSEVLKTLKMYIVNDVLDGRDVGLEPTSPLLEWGIINSFEIMSLLSFIKTKFGIDIPAKQVTAEHFKDLESLAQMVLSNADKNSTSIS